MPTAARTAPPAVAPRRSRKNGLIPRITTGTKPVCPEDATVGVEYITRTAADACAALTDTDVLTGVSFAGAGGGGRVNLITEALTSIGPTQVVEPVSMDLLREPLVSVEMFGGEAFGGEPAEEPDWQERALCAQTDPEAFFPEKGGSTREAKRICSGCEVRAECLEYALANDERFGIWGGLSERERRRLRRAAV